MSTRMLLSIVSSSALALGACSTSNRVPLPPAPKVGPKPVLVTETARWTPTLIPGTARYLISDSSIVTIGTDTSAKQVPLIATNSYEIALVSEDGFFLLHARADSATVRSAGKTTISPNPASLLSAHVSGYGRITQLDNDQPSSCSDGMDPAISRLIDLIIPLPSTSISMGDRWSDTTVTIICHGRTSLTERIIHDYKFLTDSLWHSRSVAILQRQTTIEIGATSPNPDIHSSTTGNGSASGELILDKQTARLLESTTTSSLSLTLTTTRGLFPITQTTQTHIEIHQPDIPQ